MKKGFTLIELLAVIVILGILITITVTSINSSIASSRKQALEVQMNDIYKAAETYSMNIEMSDVIYIKISTLKESGLLKNEKIINPLTNKEINGCVKMTYDNIYNQYNKEYVESC